MIATIAVVTEVITTALPRALVVPQQAAAGEAPNIAISNLAQNQPTAGLASVTGTGLVDQQPRLAENNAQSQNHFLTVLMCRPYSKKKKPKLYFHPYPTQIYTPYTPGYSLFPLSRRPWSPKHEHDHVCLGSPLTCGCGSDTRVFLGYRH